MPSIAAHMVCAKLVSNNISNLGDDFIIGNILPDIMDDNNKSHMKMRDGIYLIPNLEEAFKILDLSKEIYLGYLSHLLLDKHFLSDYLSKIYPDNIFIDGIIYIDYDIFNKDLISDYNLDINYIEKVLLSFKDDSISINKLNRNINCLKNITYGDTQYLDYNDFIRFLNEYSNIISEEIIDYENKYRKLHIHSR